MADFGLEELANRFDDCMRLGLEARERYFEQLEGENPPLAVELRALITAHEGDDGLLDEPALALVRKAAPSLPDRIGKYRVLGELGRGGMGVVYVGIHEGDEFVQEVAIKVIRRGLDTDEIVRRFKQERRILGRLAHEQISRLLDGGATPEGLPYLVMERVHGERIDDWCNRHNLSAEERIRVFRKVCSAVSYAHRQLVIHRDLKPSNIVVTDEGIPKLLDFGVAKVLSNDGSGSTATECPLHTPEYASPEQAAGRDVSTLTDVYSLGMILFEILSGSRPAVGGIRRPSDGMGKRGMRLPLGASQVDLDRVVLKALQEEPGERYQSVDQLSEDLDRWQRLQPIHARPATLPYLAHKFVLRHKVGVGVAAAVALSLSIASGWALHQTHLARQAQMRSDQRLRETRELANTLLFVIYDQVARLPGAIPVRESIVGEALRYLDSLSKDVGSDLQFRYELANGYRRLAGLQGDPLLSNKGNSVAALASLEKAVRLQESVVAASPRHVPARSFLAILYDDTARQLDASGKTVEGRALQARSLEILERLAAEQPTQRNRYMVAIALMRSSVFNLTPDLAATGMEQLARSVDLFDRLAAEGYASGDFRIQRAFAHNHIGAMYSQLRRDDTAAARHYQEALAIEQGLVQEHPERADLRYNVTFSENDLAEIDKRAGRFEKALAGYRRVLVIRESIAAADPGDVRAQDGIASACIGLSDTARQLTHLNDALRYAQRAVTLQERLAGAGSESSEPLARARWTLANAYLEWGRPHGRDAGRYLEQASRYYRLALRVYAQLGKSGQLAGLDVGSEKALRDLIAETDRLRRR